MATTQRTTGQMIANAVPAKPMWPSMPDPIDKPNTISAAATPPNTAWPPSRGIAYSRLAANLRSTGTS